MNELKPIVRRFPTYESDFCAWSADQAHRLRGLRPEGLDWENLAEEVESLGRSDRRAVGSNLKIMLEHLIKWRYQPDRRTSSWRDSIEEHRDRISRILDDCPSLAPLATEILEQEYRKARRKAIRDTGLASDNLPDCSPFTAEQVLDPDHLPVEE